MTRSIPALCIALLTAIGTAHAEDQQRQRDRLHNPAAGAQVQQQNQAQAQAQVQTQAHEQEQIYGSQLMTPEERAAHRAKMRAAKTSEEREAIRLEHHKQMQARAKKQGLTLPDTPPAMGGGMGPGQGKGSGRGMGQGSAP